MLVKMQVKLRYFPHDGKLTFSIPDTIADDPEKKKCYVDGIIASIFEVKIEEVKKDDN